MIVTNGDATTNRWTFSVDNGSPKSKGKTAGKRNLIPGRHEIKIEGNIGDNVVKAEKVFTTAAGGICEETLTLN